MMNRLSPGAPMEGLKLLVRIALTPIMLVWLTQVSAQDSSVDASARLILAHYMPWYQAKPHSDSWGWHWTMDFFDPDATGNGKRMIASHFYPDIGPYDSGDRYVHEYHLLLMKLAGIDGVIIDWYGRHDFRDYAIIHRNTERLADAVERLGMKFAICYEDRTVPALVDAKQLKPQNRVGHVVSEINWLAENWFSLDSYVRLNDRPVLLSFGQTGLTEQEWSQCLAKLKPPVSYFSQHHRRADAIGAYDWPIPAEGLSATLQFQKNSTSWSQSIPVVFPRFVDIYEQANVHKSLGRIADQDGTTFRRTLEQALTTNAKLVQIATWNDWGEGTAIEPSREYGNRDLEFVQQMRRDKIDPNFSGSASDLDLPVRLLSLRREASRSSGDVAKTMSQLDHIATLIANLNLVEARAKLEAFDPQRQTSQYKTDANVLYRTGNNLTDYIKERCRLDVYFPVDKQDYATVIWFHGGGLTKGNRVIPRGLKNKGIAVVAVGYRLSPKIKAPAYIEDAAAAVAWTLKNIERYAGSQKRVFVCGHSAGGYLASMVGLDKRWLATHGIDANQLAGIIPYSGHAITHLTVRAERGISHHQPVIDQLAPLNHVRKDAPPILLITGDREKEMLGRYEETAYFWRMLKVCGHPNPRLVELKGYDHGQMVGPAHALTLRFIQEITANR